MYNKWSEMETIFVIYFHETFIKLHKHLNCDYFFTGKNKASGVRWLKFISNFDGLYG